MIEHLSDTRRGLRGLSLEFGRNRIEQRLLLLDALYGNIAADGLDAPNTCRDTAFHDDLEQADVAGTADVRAATEFA
jgi:hypothetical protein